MQTNNRRIKVPVLIPLGLAILVLLASSILGAYLLQRHNYIDSVRIKVEGTRLLFDRQLDEDARAMSGLLDFIKEKGDLQEAWLEKNRDKLLKLSTPIFEDIHSKYKVTHFYFHGLDRTCFLRVHNPAKYGDLIDRFTLKAAVNQNQPAWGIELGTFGTFTLRVVHPWLIDGKLAGYIELGEEIEHILPILKDIFKVELCIGIDKKYVTRSSWEEGMRMMGRNDADWELLSKEVIVDSTFAKLSDESLQNIKKIFEQKSKSLFDTKIQDRDYKGGFAPLIDADKRHVGDLVVIKDVTEAQAALKTFSIILSAVCIIVGILLCVLFYAYIRRIESKLTNVYIDLQDQIEKRKQTEEKLQGAYDQMELKVQERTSQLRKLNEELEMTVAKLTSANRELADFAYVTAHDLKAPLRAIGSLAGIILTDYSDKLDERGRQYLNTLVGRTERMSNLIGGILKYSQLGQNIEKQQVDLNEIIREVIAEVAPPENIEIIQENDFPAIMCDRTHMIQVFLNLLGNAIKFMDKPKGCIRLGCVEENGFWKFSVADNGCGIKEKYFEKIFEVFQTLTRRDEIESTGIGLSMVKKIIERYDGKIWVESEPQKGSTFFFTLPKQQMEAKNEKFQTNTAG